MVFACANMRGTNIGLRVATAATYISGVAQHPSEDVTHCAGVLMLCKQPVVYSSICMIPCPMLWWPPSLALAGTHGAPHIAPALSYLPVCLQRLPHVTAAQVGSAALS